MDGLFAPFAHGVDEQIEAGAYALETHGRWMHGAMKFIGIKQKPPTSPQTNRPKKTCLGFKAIFYHKKSMNGSFQPSIVVGDLPLQGRQLNAIA